jgi:hypothetical protein
MPSSVDLVAKGHNAFVSVTHDDGLIEWVPFKTQLAAEEASQAMKLGLEDATDVTLAAFYNRYMSHDAIPNLRPGTVDDYSRVFEAHIRPFIGDKVLSSITADDVRGLEDTLRANERSNRQITRAQHVLSTIMGTAVKWRYIPLNPVNYIDAVGLTNAPK